MTGYEDGKESPTMREIHRIQEEMEQQYQKSGLPSYEEWLQATEEELRQSLAEIGYRMIIRDDRFFLYEIKPRPQKNNGKYKTPPKSKVNNSAHSSLSPKNYKYKTVLKRSKTNVRKK